MSMKFLIFRQRKAVAAAGDVDVELSEMPSTPRGRRARCDVVLQEKTEKFGDVLREETISSKTRCVVIAGPHNCGKTRYLNKMRDSAEAIWAGQLKPAAKTARKTNWTFPEPLTLAGLNPVVAWLDNDGVEAWWNETRPEEKPWAKLQQYKKIEALPDYLKERRAVLLVDDAHKLVGRKLQVVKSCLMAAPRAVLTCEDEGMISTSLRQVLLSQNPQYIRLHSDASYDYTAVLMWLLMGLFVAAGQWELAAVIGGLKYLSGGRRAAKI